MRKKEQKQMPIMLKNIDHPHAEELSRISQILDDNPIIYNFVWQDLTRNLKVPGKGAQGMTAEQVLRAAIIKQMESYSYEALAFHLLDSLCYRSFCRMSIVDKGFQKSALNNNIKTISAETWEAINHIILACAVDSGIEKGRESRIDCTVVSSNIHAPSDSSLLWDCVRVLTRKLSYIHDLYSDLNIHFSDHTKRAKRRSLGVMNAKNKNARKECYVDLIKVTTKTVGYTETAINLLESACSNDPVLMGSAINTIEDLNQILELTYKVIGQTTRRVLNGESVPANEKVDSIFEPHTDIIVKDRRDTYYGHKICLSGGSSNLITDCLIVEGNPADTTLTGQMLDRHEQIYGHYPLKIALDGGFASKDNLEYAKSKEIKNVCFSKRLGLKIGDMCRSDYVYKRLRNFRAGIESGISWLKRSFGLTTCTWKTLPSFKSYVWASIVSANLLTLARQ